MITLFLYARVVQYYQDSSIPVCEFYAYVIDNLQQLFIYLFSTDRNCCINKRQFYLVSVPRNWYRTFLFLIYSLLTTKRTWRQPSY